MTVIQANDKEYELLDFPFWHLVSKDGVFSDVFYHNVNLGEGILATVSLIAYSETINGFQTPYSFSRINDEKEMVFEQVRESLYPHLPSRFKSLYVFDLIETADKAKEEWFVNNQKDILECRIVDGSVLHRADATWLECSKPHWGENAKKYWSGETSDSPFIEVLVHGLVYFPKWILFNKKRLG